MTILTRFGALTALSALAACGTATTTTPGATSTVDVSGMLAKAGMYDAVTTEDHENLNTAVRDAALAGVTGYMGFQDGSVVPVRVRVSSDTTKAYISIDGGEEIEFDYASSSYSQTTWSGEESNADIWLNDYASAQLLRIRDSANNGQGYFGIQTALEDLPQGNGVYAGNYYMVGQQSDYGTDYSSGRIALNVNFAEGTVEGSLVGNIYLPSEFVPEDEYDYYYNYYNNGIYGDIEGAVDGGTFVASVDVTGHEASNYDVDRREIDGSLEMMGAVYSNGTTVAGGIGGTISESEMGGHFSASEGYYSY